MNRLTSVFRLQAAAADRQASVKCASPETETTALPSIMVTHPSVKGRCAGHNKKFVLFDDPDESGITGSVSSDSDECGGFTPPPDGQLQSVKEEVLSGQMNGQRSQGMNEVSAGPSTLAGKGEVESSVNGTHGHGKMTGIRASSSSSSDKSPSPSHRFPRGKKGDVAKKPWTSPVISMRRNRDTNVSGNGEVGRTEVDGDVNSNGDGYDLDDDKPLSPRTWERVRVRAKTQGEKEMSWKKDTRNSVHFSPGSPNRMRQLPTVPGGRHAKPWTSPLAAAAARRERELPPKSVVGQLQSGEKPFRIHIADLDVPVDKGMKLSDEAVSKILEASDSLYAVAGYNLNADEQVCVKEEFKDTQMNNDVGVRPSSTSSFGGKGYEDPTYEQVGPATVHPETPTAKEMEPGYAIVEERTVSQSAGSRSNALDSERVQGYANDETVSLGEVIDPGYAAVRNVMSSGGENAQPFVAGNNAFDTFSIGEVSEPGYARVKILTVGEDAGGNTEMVLIVDSDSDDDAVGYSRVGHGQLGDDPSDDDDIPDPGYQRIADVRQQLSAVLTRDEVNALYAQVNKRGRVEGQSVDDPSALYSKVMKVKVEDPSALYSRVKKMRDKSPLYSKVDKQRRGDATDRSTEDEVTVDDLNALYAKVVKRKKERKESDGKTEKRVKRRLPRVPADGVDGEHTSLRDKAERLEKKLLLLSCGLGENEAVEEKDKEKPCKVDILQTPEGLVKKRMEFFSRQSTPSSDSESVVRRKRTGRASLVVGNGTSFSSSIDSMSDAPTSARTSLNSPLNNISPLAVSPQESLVEETQTSSASRTEQRKATRLM